MEPPAPAPPGGRGRWRRDAADRGVLLFMALAFGGSWALWAGALLADGTAWSTPLQAAATFGPAAAALVLARRGGRGSALRAHVAFRGAGRATLAAVVLPPGLVFLALLAEAALGGDPTIAWPEPLVWPLVIGYVLVLGGPLGEELGWRGHALPRLEHRYGPVGATVFLGAIWTAWHLPLFVLPGTIQQEIPLWVFAWQIVATSFVYTWLRHRTPASLVPVLAFHTSFNVTVGIALVGAPAGPALRPLVIALVLTTLLAIALARTPTFQRPMVAAIPAPGGDGHIRPADRV